MNSQNIEDDIWSALNTQRFDTKLRDAFLKMLESGDFDKLEKKVEVKIGTPHYFLLPGFQSSGEKQCLHTGEVSYRDLLQLAHNRDVFYIDQY